MFKRIICLSLFLFCVLSTFAQIPPVQDFKKEILNKSPEFLWGLVDSYKKDYNKYHGLNGALITGRVFYTITENGAREKPTNISDKNLAEKNALENELNKSNREKDLSDMITKAFKVWFEDTKVAIEKAGRQQEFKDIMSILNKSVEPASDENLIAMAKLYEIPMVIFYFTTENNVHKECCKGYPGCGGCKTITPSAGTNVSKIITVNPYTNQKSSYFTKNNIYKTLIHEIGHYYGLADQYRVDGVNSNNSDKEYSTGSDRTKNYSSIMAAGDYMHLTCDDVDGFINLIDFTLAKQNEGKFSKRSQNGWASFCNGKKGYKNTYYKMAKPVKSGKSSAKQANNANNNPSSNIQIKPFTFYSSQHKYDFTYNKDNLMATKNDEAYSYNYSYYRNNGTPTIKVSVVGKDFFATNKNRGTWELPVGYEIKEERYNTGHYIDINGNQCNIVNYVPFSDEKSYSVSYKDGKLQPEYTYSLPLGKRILELHKYETLAHPVCLVKDQYNMEVIKLVGSTFDNIESMAGVSRNQYILDDIAQAEGKTRREIIDTLKTECRKTLHHSITTNTKELCSYFKKVDDYFNK